MPLIRKEKINGKSVWATWKITENASQLRTCLNLNHTEQNLLAEIKNHEKKMEWMASRLIIRELLKLEADQHLSLSKDQYNKPFIKDSLLELSISHSFPFACVILHENQPVGIDIEKPRKTLKNVAKKFLDENELLFAGEDLSILSILWSAKETLYKIHGKKKLAFREHLKVDPFELKSEGLINGKIIQESEPPSLFQMKYEMIENHFVVYNI